MRLHPRPPGRAPRLLGAFLVGLVVVSGLMASAAGPPPGPPWRPSRPPASPPATRRSPCSPGTASTGATDYDVQVSRTADFATTLVSATTVSATYVPQVELPADEVWWRVRARVGAARSDWTTSSMTPRQRTAPVAGATAGRHGLHASPDAAVLVAAGPGGDVLHRAGQPGRGLHRPRPDRRADPEDDGGLPRRVPRGGLLPLAGPGAARHGVRHRVVGRPAVRGGLHDRGRAHRTGDVHDKDVPEDVLPDRRRPRLGAPARCRDLRRAHRHRPQFPVRRPPAARCHRHPVLPTGGTPQRRLLLAGARGQRQRPGQCLARDPLAVHPGLAGPAWVVHPTGTYRQRGTPFFYEWEPVEHASSYQVHLYDADGRQLCKTERTRPRHPTTAPEPRIGGRMRPVARRQTTSGASWPSTSSADRVDWDPIPTVLARTGSAPGSATAPPAPDNATLDRLAIVTGQAASFERGRRPGPGRSRPERLHATVPDQCDRLRQTPVLTWDRVPGATSYRVLFTNDAAGTNPYQASGVGRRDVADVDTHRLVPRQPGWLRVLLAGAAL